MLVMACVRLPLSRLPVLGGMLLAERPGEIVCRSGGLGPRQEEGRGPGAGEGRGRLINGHRTMGAILALMNNRRG